jgi:class 3 adenylate cyclase
MADSTALVDSSKPHFAAEIYKSYLHCAARIVHNWGGEVTAYDGDRLMAVFIGDTKNTSAVTVALKLNYARLYIINPAVRAQYPGNSYELKQVVGIDTSSLFVARTGVRGANDLVWVGKAANHAAKLSALPHDFAIRITKEVYNNMRDSVKYDGGGRNMWEAATWTAMSRDIYRSNYYWSL